ncbi:serine/threonine-protein kinase HAL4/sat4, partial [Quaeritorhiza haematococci]
LWIPVYLNNVRKQSTSSDTLQTSSAAGDQAQSRPITVQTHSKNAPVHGHSSGYSALNPIREGEKLASPNSPIVIISDEDSIPPLSDCSSLSTRITKEKSVGSSLKAETPVDPSEPRQDEEHGQQEQSHPQEECLQPPVEVEPENAGENGNGSDGRRGRAGRIPRTKRGKSPFRSLSLSLPDRFFHGAIPQPPWVVDLYKEQCSQVPPVPPIPAHLQTPPASPPSLPTKRPAAPSSCEYTPRLHERYGSCQEKIIGKGATACVRVVITEKPCSRGTEKKIYAVKKFRKRRTDETERTYIKKLTSEFCISSR